MNRRQFLALTAAAARAETKPDISLRISRANVELSPRHSVNTLVYNDRSPGPLLRMAEGKEITVEIVNDTKQPEMVHWHGFHVPPEVDGAHEEGTPMVQGLDRRRYTFTPKPAGTRWYHTHAMAGHDLRVGLYSGQFGMCIVDPREAPARYDAEVPIVFHEWEPFFESGRDMDVSYRLYSINGKMLGAGEPIKVKTGQRVLFRLLNASATTRHRLALAGHTFRIVALDGNPVPKPADVPVVDLAPGERADAIVEMKNPGVWTLGEEDNAQRAAGAGIDVEYAGSRGPAKWIAPKPYIWDYSIFSDGQPAPEPAARIPIVIEPGRDGNLWAINGKSWPNTDPITLHGGERNRFVVENRGDMDHPVHLHRHTFELVSAAGVMKDVVVVPAHKTVELDVMANNPGPSLFHCHQQFHMDFGFMALIRYSRTT